MSAILEARLKQAAAGMSDDFHFQLRERIGKKATAALETRLKGWIMLLPKLLSKMHRHFSRSEAPPETKMLAGLALNYLYRPADFLPEAEGTLFGYLDDAYFAALAYEKILRELSKPGTPGLSRFDRDFLKNIGLLKRNVNLVIPEEARKISEILNALLNTRTEALYAAVV